MGAARSIASLLFILAVPVALFTTNVRFIANEPSVYRYAIDQHDAVTTTGIERGELIRAGAELRRYFNDGEDTVMIRVQQNGRETSLFNPRETAHLRDVKDRFQTLNRVQEFSLLYVLVYIAAVVLWAREVTLRRLALQVIGGCLIALVVVAAAGAFGFSGFDSAWTDFHELIFSNDFWRLNPATDHLIQIYPPAFWESIVFFIGLMVAAEAALILVAAGIYLGVTGRHHQAPPHLEPYYA